MKGIVKGENGWRKIMLGKENILLFMLRLFLVFGEFCINIYIKILYEFLY